MIHRPRYSFADTPDSYRAAANTLAAGRGPFAIDTERASAFRYDDRAFLVQIHRRDAGTFLIAPEGKRDDVKAIFAPIINEREWVLHAAAEDLESLGLLGLHPKTVFDTELAARLCGFQRPNLKAVVHQVLNVELEKNHGREDWSCTPLPTAWLDYAARDVAYLNDLADSLAELLDHLGLLDAAAQEFSHLVAAHSQPDPRRRTWCDMKGVASLHTPGSLQLARALWQARDSQARETDTSPAAILANSVLLAIAKAVPSSRVELQRVPGFPGRDSDAVEWWYRLVEGALSEPETTWPDVPLRAPCTIPAKSIWQRHYPHSWLYLREARRRISVAATRLGMPPESLLSPSTLREVVWQATSEAHPDEIGAGDTHSARNRLLQAGARPWQASIVAPLLAAAEWQARATRP